jgi:hypothetical protein
LANGGPSSVLTVCRALQQGTPVIVIEVNKLTIVYILRHFSDRVLVALQMKLHVNIETCMEIIRQDRENNVQ